MSDRLMIQAAVGYRGHRTGSGPTVVSVPKVSDTRAARLRSSSAVRAVFAARCRSDGDAMTLHARRRMDGRPTRATVVAGRKVGRAVQRNRAKRRLRAVIDGHGEIPAGWDLVLVARAATLSRPFAELQTEFSALLQRVTQEPS